MASLLVQVMTLVLLAGVCRCDYACLCSYTTESAVHANKSTETLLLGYLYEFDCKILMSGANDTWKAIVFDHQLGYIMMEDGLEIESCAGEPTDTLTTATPMAGSTDAEMTEPPTTAPLTTPSTTPPYTPDHTRTTPLTFPTTPEITMPTSTVPTTMGSSSTLWTDRTTSATPSSTLWTDRTTPATPSSTLMTDRTTPPPPSSPSATPVSHNIEVIDGCSDKHLHFAYNEAGILFTYRHNCYEIVPAELEWYLAEQDCVAKGGHLVHITDTYEQHAIFLVLQQHHGKDVWIGLHDRESEGEFTWSSGDRLNYTNWTPDFSSLIHSIEDCVTMLAYYAGEWDEVLCGSDRGYICEFDAVPVNHTIDVTTPISPDTALTSDGNTHLCPAQIQGVAGQYDTVLAQYGNSCYEILHNKVSWTEAERLCVLAGGHLATINDAHEQAYVDNLMSRHNTGKAVWIGLHDLNTEGTLEWTSEQPVTFTNWVDGHMDNFVDHTQEDCVALIPYQNGLWDDIPCGNGEEHLSFCEYAITDETMEATIVG